MVSSFRSTFLALCATLCMGVSPAFAADSLTEIQTLMRQGQYPQALGKVDDYLANRPKDAQGRFMKGLILTELKRGGDAIAIFTKLTEDYPELPEPYNNLAVLYAQQKQYDRARAALEMAIRTHPSYAIAYENLGDVYAKLASQAYDKALQLDTSNAAAQSKLAMIRDLVSAPGGGSRPVNVASAPTPLTPFRTTSVASEQARASQPRSQPSVTVVSTTPTSTSTTTVATTTAVTSADSTSAAATRPTKSELSVPAAAAQDVTQALAAWAAAWSRQDVKAYLGAYAPAFKPPKGASRKDWEAERTARIRRPAWIKVSYSEPQIEVDGKQASAHFRQRYQASNLKTSTAKTIVFTKVGNTWLILSEESH